MGLDIQYYRGLEPAEDFTLDEDGDPEPWDQFFKPGPAMDWSEGHWPGRAAPLNSETVYKFRETDGFRAGSYGGYSLWRDWLAQHLGYASARDFWDTAPDDAPFYELLNFADNEGVIGWTVAKKLAADFAAHDPDGDAGQRALYQRFKTAFETAADQGAVDFH